MFCIMRFININKNVKLFSIYYKIVCYVHKNFKPNYKNKSLFIELLICNIYW